MRSFVSRCLPLLLLAPLLLVGCSFQCVCVKSCSLRCAADDAPAPTAASEPIIQLASCSEPEQPQESTGPQACGRPCPRPQWGGIYPTVLTPWNCDGTVDAAALAVQIEYQLAGGVHGLLVLGTLGEGQYTNAAGREVVISTAVAAAKGCVPVVVGIHTADAYCAIEQMRQAKRLGAAAALVKFTGCPNSKFCQAFAFFNAVANAPADAQLPIFIYYYPALTGIKHTPQEIAYLLMLPNVVGIKESLLDLNHIEEQMRLVCGWGKIFLSGTALNLTQFQAIGGHGAMCPEAALMPCRTVNAYRLAYENCCTEAAREIQKQLFVIAPLLTQLPVSEGCARQLTMTSADLRCRGFAGAEASPAKMKAAMGGLGIPISPLVAPPQKQLGACDRLQVERALEKLPSLAP